jgi:hypothetical protein
MSAIRSCSSRTAWLHALMILALGTVVAGGASGAPRDAPPPGAIVDQQSWDSNWHPTDGGDSYNGVAAAQTFTAGVSGQLTNVAVNVSNSPPLRAQIEAVNSDGSPDDFAVLGSAPVIHDQFSGDAVFSPTIPVTAGQRLAIVLIPDTSSGVFDWTWAVANSIAGAQGGWYSPCVPWPCTQAAIDHGVSPWRMSGGDGPYDQQFKTFVVPNDSSLSLPAISQLAPAPNSVLKTNLSPSRVRRTFLYLDRLGSVTSAEASTALALAGTPTTRIKASIGNSSAVPLLSVDGSAARACRSDRAIMSESYLRDGRHSVRLTAANGPGFSKTVAWSFTVRTTLGGLALNWGDATLPAPTMALHVARTLNISISSFRRGWSRVASAYLVLASGATSC